MSLWRDNASQIIRSVILEVGRKDEKKLRKALSDAYPFGERKYTPYKIWLDEIKRQVGTKKAGPDLFTTGEYVRGSEPQKSKIEGEK
jgi:hypothetical protein